MRSLHLLVALSMTMVAEAQRGMRASQANADDRGTSVCSATNDNPHWQDGSVFLSVPSGALRIFSNEDPSKETRTIYLQEFLFSKFDVTNAQYAYFVKSSGYFSGDQQWQKYAAQRGIEAPVVCVSWGDAVAYCDWAGLRLASWAEWDRAKEYYQLPCGQRQWVSDWYGSPKDSNDLHWFNSTPSALDWVVRGNDWFGNYHPCSLIYSGSGRDSMCLPFDCNDRRNTVGFRCVHPLSN